MRKYSREGSQKQWDGFGLEGQGGLVGRGKKEQQSCEGETETSRGVQKRVRDLFRKARGYNHVRRERTWS